MEIYPNLFKYPRVLFMFLLMIDVFFPQYLLLKIRRELLSFSTKQQPVAMNYFSVCKKKKTKKTSLVL